MVDLPWLDVKEAGKMSAAQNAVKWFGMIGNRESARRVIVKNLITYGS
jgi:hypothetical protein